MAHPFLPSLRILLSRELAVFERPSDLPAKAALKAAAVAIVIVPDPGTGEAAFLLTRRAATLRGHPGQWALPGGRCDPGETARNAALRELQEELGLRLPATAILGELDDYPTRSGYRITPVIAWAEDPAALMPNPAEVASVHFIPLDTLTQPDAVSFVSIPESEGQVVRLRLVDTTIHAPTAALLYQLGELLNGRHTRVAHLEQPVFAWR